MKIFKLISTGFLALLISFLIFFIGLEIYKHTSGNELFRARHSYDLVIKNARIIDGTGGEITRADIGIRNNIIVRIDKRLRTEGARVFDAVGYTVAPSKVNWPENLDWVKRDLNSALVRYPEHRIIIAEAQAKEWCGQSVKGLLSNKSLSRDILASDLTAVAFITPDLGNLDTDDVSQAYYQLSGWRSELLDVNLGKIKEGFLAQLVIFNHREINDEQLLSYLREERLPPIQYIIEGSNIQSNPSN